MNDGRFCTFSSRERGVDNFYIGCVWIYSPIPLGTYIYFIVQPISEMAIGVQIAVPVEVAIHALKYYYWPRAVQGTKFCTTTSAYSAGPFFFYGGEFS